MLFGGFLLRLFSLVCAFRTFRYFAGFSAFRMAVFFFFRFRTFQYVFSISGFLGFSNILCFSASSMFSGFHRKAPRQASGSSRAGLGVGLARVPWVVVPARSGTKM